MKYENIELLSIADENNIICKRHSFFSKNVHWHNYYELELVTAGKGTHIINGTSYRFRAGDVFLLRPSDFHEFDLKEEGTTYLIEIPPSLFPMEVIDILIHTTNNLLIHFNDAEFNILKNIFHLIESHYKKEGYVNSMITNSLLCSLLLLFTENIDNGSLNNISKTNERLREIIFYIQQNFRQDITLENLSSMFYINKEYLCALFKSETGTNLTAYIRKLRLSYAAKLAVTTELKSIDISEKCGFNSVPTFLRNFKEEYGVSPLQMRKNSKKSPKRF